MHLFLPLHQMFPPQQMMHAGEVSLFTNVIHSTVHVCAGIASCLSIFREAGALKHVLLGCPISRVAC